MFSCGVDQVLQAFWVKYFITDNCWKDIELIKLGGGGGGGGGRGGESFLYLHPLLDSLSVM